MQLDEKQTGRCIINCFKTQRLSLFSVPSQVIELPLTNPELFQRVGIIPPKGCLLYGPPGEAQQRATTVCLLLSDCGKSLLCFSFFPFLFLFFPFLFPCSFFCFLFSFFLSSVSLLSFFFLSPLSALSSLFLLYLIFGFSFVLLLSPSFSPFPFTFFFFSLLPSPWQAVLSQ